MPNLKNFDRLKEAVRSEPQKLNMNQWACGSVRCLGGWCSIMMLEEDENLRKETNNYPLNVKVEVVADWLGIPYDTARELFFPEEVHSWERISAEEALAAIEVVLAGGNLAEYWRGLGK